MSFPQTSSALLWQRDSFFQSIAPHIPPYCEPSSRFLLWVSSAFHTCIPTPLAFLSTVLGFLSILSWLFAQLPQIIKNYKLRSTSGLSIFFLVEWCLGDLSNLLGALLTEQATWQVIVAAYYCFVDVVLVAQWTWFEGFGKGNQIVVKTHRHRRHSNIHKGNDGLGYQHEDMQQVSKPVESSPQSTPKQITTTPLQQSFFHTPNYGSVPSSSATTYTNSPKNPGPTGRAAMPRLQSNFPFPSPSPRTTLFLTLVLALASASTTTAAPSPSTHHYNSHHHNHSHHNHYTTPPLGTIFSWASTVLYLFSRLPQLIKNFSRRSTAGLSPLLFLAAFFGNFFYSTSLLTNPCLWHDFPAHGGGGWADAGGSMRGEWAVRALPFFLGAAVVLFMDAGVGVQFWLWGEKESDAILLQHSEEGFAHSGVDGGESQGASAGSGAGAGVSVGQAEAQAGKKRKRRWTRPTGWMRGWVPSGERLRSMRWSRGSSVSSSVASTVRAEDYGAARKGTVLAVAEDSEEGPLLAADASSSSSSSPPSSSSSSSGR